MLLEVLFEQTDSKKQISCFESKCANYYEEKKRIGMTSCLVCKVMSEPKKTNREQGNIWDNY